MEDLSSPELTSRYESPTFGKDVHFQLDKPVGSMSISPCGRDVVLASRQGLHIIDLDSPWEPPRYLPHQTPWEVADVQWSPFPSRDHWVVSTSNQKALVWNLAMPTTNSYVQYYLHAHDRAITDINFSAHHPDLLATCAVDSFVHCWDLRHPARPAMTFSDWFAGATQVKWNRKDSHIVASSHDKFLRIWDDRKGAYPLRSIEAHATKIYGLDWNRTMANAAVTCSLDKTIKFWDISKDSNEPDWIINTPFPVCRARHTPFGHGLLAMPQRGDNNLHLYDRQHIDTPNTVLEKPVKSFEGHEAQVKEFLWRANGSVTDGIDNRDFQLVSWGADRFLRLHQLDEAVLKGVGFVKGRTFDKELNFTRKNAINKTYRDHSMSSLQSEHEHIHGISAAHKAGSFPSPSIYAPSSHDGLLASRYGQRAISSSRKDMDPISWMKGVKIGKKDPVEIHGDSLGTATNFQGYKAWDDFESLGEEIAHVGTKFSKVEFKEIDVQNRYVKISTNGLLGPDETSVYLECRFDFPKDYPGLAAPIFTLEKTASIEETTMSKLRVDIKTLSEAYLEFQRSSLEALVRYLQGDQSIDDALASAKDQHDSQILHYGGENESSSEEEDDLGGISETQPEDFGLANSGSLNYASANANMPLPKATGAVWAKDGRLVCFFPPKEDKVTSLAGSFGLGGRGSLFKGKKKYLEGFGRMQYRSRSKSKSPSLGTVESSDSDSFQSSSTSSESSSDSSSSSPDASAVGHYAGAHFAIRTEFLDFPEVLNGPPKSAESASLARSAPSAPKSYISIHDLASLLPSQKTLAQEYTLTSLEGSIQNAQIAAKNGREDVSKTWSLLHLLLRNQVPLETKLLEDEKVMRGSPNVLVSMKNDPPNQQRSSQNETTMKRPVRWGWHPFGKFFLIQNLFSYYERLEDPQMLAMMAFTVAPLLLKEPGTNKGNLTRGAGNTNVVGQSRSGQSFSVSQDSATSIEYFPSLEVATSFIRADSQGHSSSDTMAKFKMDPPSLASSYGAQGSDQAQPELAGITPPTLGKTTHKHPDRSQSISYTISSSPEKLKLLHRSSTNLASAFAASLPRPFSFTASASSSPPNLSLPKKRASPLGSQVTNTSRSMAVDNKNTISSKMSRLPGEPRSIDSKLGMHDVSPKRQVERNPAYMKSDAVYIQLKNQDQFQIDNYPDPAPIASSDELKYRSYRQRYANLLSIWEMPQDRTEILKSNDHQRNLRFSKEPAPKGENPSLQIGQRAGQKPSLPPKKNVLNLGLTCYSCSLPGISSEPGISGSKCPSCGFQVVPPTCTFCAEFVLGRASPCLGCGHVMHTACMEFLFDQDERWLYDGECITGCGCRCPQHTQAAVEWPQLQGPPEDERAYWSHRSSGPSTIRDMTDSRSVHAPENAWEDVAYESLAKNLGSIGAKYIKPRSSQIWIGKDKNVKPSLNSN